MLDRWAVRISFLVKSTPEREKATEEKGNAADIKREVDCVEKDSILMESGPGWRPALLWPRRQDTSMNGSLAPATTSHQVEAQEVDCVEKDSILMDGSNQEGIRGIAHSLSLHLVAWFPGVEPTKKPQAGSLQTSGPGWRPALLWPRRQDTSVDGCSNFRCGLGRRGFGAFVAIDLASFRND
jgi:hypothetical protein